MWKIDPTYLNETQELLSRLKEKKAEVDNLRPIPQMGLDRLREELSLEWTYNSNGIEGNTLTLNETRVVLEDGITIGGKSLREHFETLNHHKAIDYLIDIVSPQYEIRAIDILNIHEMVMKNIQDDFAGRIRNGAVRISGANFTPPNPNKVSDLLDELIAYTNENPDNLDDVILASVFHHKLVWIHPFFDGNGRTTRLAMNLLLMRHGYPPAIILKNDRKKYYSALNLANKGDYSKLALIMIQATERSLNFYLNLAPEHYQDYLPISNLVQEPYIPYGMEYISLLARTGKINAHKEGRNWFTTKEAVLEHYDKRKK